MSKSPRPASPARRTRADRAARSGHLVRVPERTYQTLVAISRETKQPMSRVVAAVLESYRRDRIFAEAAAAYRANPPDEELAAWDGTLLDGLSEESDRA